jgi:hypothetical protein
MNEILHANIFFVIASLATICFCVLISIVLYHLIKIMQSIRAILTRVEEGSEIIAEDLSHLRAAIMEGGIVARLIGLFFGSSKKSGPKRKRTFTRTSQHTHGKQETSEEDDRTL